MARIIYDHEPGSFWRRVWCNLWHGWGHTRTYTWGVWMVCACGWRGRAVDDEEELPP